MSHSIVFSRLDPPLWVALCSGEMELDPVDPGTKLGPGNHVATPVAAPSLGLKTGVAAFKSVAPAASEGQKPLASSGAALCARCSAGYPAQHRGGGSPRRARPYAVDFWLLRARGGRRWTRLMTAAAPLRWFMSLGQRVARWASALLGKARCDEASALNP